MRIYPQMVRCTHGARTPEASWVWGRARPALIHLNTSDLCRRSLWSRSLQGESRASPSPCLEVCSAGGGTTVDSSGWETGQVERLVFLSYIYYNIYVFVTCKADFECIFYRQTYTYCCSMPELEENCSHCLWKGPHCHSDQG